MWLHWHIKCVKQLLLFKSPEGTFYITQLLAIACFNYSQFTFLMPFSKPGCNADQLEVCRPALRQTQVLFSERTPMETFPTSQVCTLQDKVAKKSCIFHQTLYFLSWATKVFLSVVLTTQYIFLQIFCFSHRALSRIRHGGR